MEAQRRISGLSDVAGPPALPTGGRWSLRPDEIRSLHGRFVAEIGVGVVHGEHPLPQAHVDVNVECLHRRLKKHFDPEGRLNPGRDALAVC